MVDPTVVPDQEPPEHLAWVCYFPNTGRRLWSGDVEITYDGNTYEPGRGIIISEAPEVQGQPSGRAEASFIINDPADLPIFLQDIGPDPVEREWIYSIDRGETWLSAGNRSVARVSNGHVIDGTYSCEFETHGSGPARDVDLKISHETQMARASNGVDRAFEMTKQGENAAIQEITWPQ